MKLQVKPPYKPLVQMPWTCAACALLWVLHRRGYWIDQETIAKDFDVRIPPKFKKLFSVKLKTCRKKEDCGSFVFTREKVALIKKILKKHKIPLKPEIYLISRVKDPKKLIIKNMKAGNDILLSFCWRGLGKRWNWGHVVVIAEFDTKTNTITLGDPSMRQKKFWKIKLNKITNAMQPKWDKIERGFYIFSRK